MNLDHMRRAADEAALATGRDFVLVRINGGNNVRLLDLAEFFNLPEVLEVELLHSTLAARVRLVIGPRPSYMEHDGPASAIRQEHQASRRVGPLDRRARERGKIANFFRDLFFVSSHHMLLVAVLILAGLTATGCSNPTAPTTPRVMCVDSWVDGALVPGPCTEIP